MPRKRLWFLGLALVSAIALTTLGPGLGQPWFAQAQTPTPAPAVTPEPAPPSPGAPTPAVTPEPAPPSPGAPTPAVTPEPAPPSPGTPTPAVTPEPAVTPAPAATPTPAPAPTLQPAGLPLAAEPYQDPGQRFQIGVLQDYKQSSLTGVPLFESPEGQVAYTVAIRPRANDALVAEPALAQVAIDTFGRGEGLEPGAFEVEPTGGAKVPWRGTLTQGRNTQPMQGLMLSRQVPGRLLILMVAATEEAAGQLEPVYRTLAPTLQPLAESPEAASP